MIETNYEAIMQHVIEEAKRLERAGLLDKKNLNPQILATLRQVGGVRLFDAIVQRDSVTIAQAQPGVMVRQVVAIV